MMRWFVMLLIGSLCVLLMACMPNQAAPAREVILLSTTTTRDTGLLDTLVPAFERQSNLRVKTISAGSGEILKLGERGEGDVILAHSPAAEEAFVAAGHGLSRTLVMHNDFVIVGPSNDPAKVRGLKVNDALKNIAAAKSPFVSRGDQSGTHVKELALWKAAAVEVKGQAWYLETGAGQGQTLNVATEKGAYTLTDRGTYLSLKKNLALDVLVEKDAGLLNIYHVMLVNPARSPNVNAAGAQAFAAYLVSAEAQNLIRTFGVDKFGQALFVPDVGKTVEQVLAGK